MNFNPGLVNLILQISLRCGVPWYVNMLRLWVVMSYDTDLSSPCLLLCDTVTTQMISTSLFTAVKTKNLTLVSVHTSHNKAA
jgi:hypothetical protein